MANFIPIQNNFSTISSDFSQQVQDSFGNSIKNEILEPMEQILSLLSFIEENEKKITIMEVNQLLLEARSILP